MNWNSEVWAKAMHHPDVQAAAAPFLARLRQLVSGIDEIDAPGYVPLLKPFVRDEFTAKMYVGIVRHLAIVAHVEYLERRSALIALNSLARRKRWDQAVARTAAELKEVDLRSVIDDLLSPDELKSLEMDVESAAAGDRTAGKSLISRAKKLIKHLVPPRGRQRDFRTFVHAFTIIFARHLAASATSAPPDTEAATEAARAEWGHFDRQASVRLAADLQAKLSAMGA